MQDATFQFSAGHRLDSFEITAPIYEGALAEVYRGIDTLTRQTVVIKVPSLDIINHPLVYYHFQNESRVLAKINHPRIVSIIHRDRSAAYSVFEYIPGMDLREHMKHKKMLSLEKARHYIAQAAQGLSHIHSCGIIHLDIKPENIMVTPLDTVKIVDFGLARALGTTDLLQEDFIRPHGTPYYAAPEQLTLYRDDPRIDLYSLAVVLYELLTGQLPFEKSKDLTRVKRRLKTDPVPPRRYRKALPEAVEAVILRALSRRAEDRYGSVQAFIQALDKASGGHSSGGYPWSRKINRADGACPFQPTRKLRDTASHGIVAAIDDNGQADVVVESALQEAIVTGSHVTLLTVVSRDSSDDWVRFGDEVKGKQWGQRLDHFVRKFNHYGFDPVVRIRTGIPALEIVETAKAAHADLIILGPSSKKWFKRMFGGRTIDRVLKIAPCRVKVAHAPVLPRFPKESNPEALTVDDLKEIDYYLVALWIQQLNWLATIVQGLLSEPQTAQNLSVQDSPMAIWIRKAEIQNQWAPRVQKIADPLVKLHHTVRQMVDSVKEGNPIQLRQQYLTKALPLLCRLREGIKTISLDLREQCTLQTYRRIQALEQGTCPIDHQHTNTGGPIHKIQAIRAYFCTHPDAAPEACLHYLNETHPEESSERTEV